MNTTIFRLLAVALGATAGAALAADPIQLLSARNASLRPVSSASGDSGLALTTPDGRFVLFASSAEDLVLLTNDAPIPYLPSPRLNVYRRDRANATTTLVSLNLPATGGGNGDSWPAGISSNGRYALFESTASDLVPNDTNGVADVFVRDLTTGITLPVSVGTDGSLGSGASYSSVLTPDGRFAAFTSAATNLVVGDTNGVPDVFLRDLQSGTTTLVSVGADPGRPGTANGGSGAPDITPDGRFMAFYSTATNLVPGATNVGEIYVRDLLTGTTLWASSYARTALQTPQNTLCLSFGHSLSADGQFVTYEAIRSILYTKPIQAPITLSPGGGVILRYNLTTGLTDLVGTNAAVPITTPEDARNPVMTPDGRFASFVANVANGFNTNTCVWVWDAHTGTNILVSGDLTGAVPTNALSGWPTITPDGRWIAFLSNGTNLVTNALSGEFHLYVRDLLSNTTTLIDTDPNGLGLGTTPVMQPRLSDDCRLAAFEAYSSSLVPDDSNQAFDVFVRDPAGATNELVSSHNQLLPSNTPNGPSTLCLSSVSSEGSLVAFVSEASNLTPNDTNGFRDVFVRDLLANTTLLVSADSSGVATGNGMSTDPTISADARYVAFTSTATNLVSGDNNSASDVFVRDLLTGITELVSVNTNGVSGNRASYAPILSADGRAVLFHSRASDLAPGAFGTGIENLFWRDRWSGTTYPLTAYSLHPGYGLAATMSANGRFAALGAQNSNWYIWDSQAAAMVYTNATATGSAVNHLWVSADASRIVYSATNFSDLYLVDRAAGTSNVLGTILSPALASPCFSADGRFIAYATTSSIASTDTNLLSDVYLYDCQTGSNVLVSQSFDAPASASGDSDSPAISADGRFIAYRSAACNLVPNDTNGVPDVFLWDRITGATMLISVNRALTSSANNRSLRPVFSGDGRTLMFESWAADLVPGDYNRSSDLFVVNVLSGGAIPLLRASILPASPDQGLWISWPVVLGKSYQVEFKDTVADPAWQVLSSGVTILGAQGYMHDPAPGGNQRFYRVVAQ